MYKYFLIAGTPCIGKSTLSGKLLSLGMAVSDLDLVRDIVSHMHPSEKLLSKSFFEVTLAEYIQQCEIMAPAINGMINGIVKNKQHVVILGAHMLPGIESKDTTKDWTKILITIPDEELHWRQFSLRAKNDKRKFIQESEPRLREKFKKARDYQNHLILLANTNNWHIIEHNGDELNCLAKLLSIAYNN